MIRRLITTAIFLLSFVTANAQVVKCTLKSRDHKTDYYSCEDGYSRSYVRKDLLKEPNPHKVMYSCQHHEPSGFAFAWTDYNLGVAAAFQNGLFLNKPTSDCDNILSLVKKDGIAQEKADVRRFVNNVFNAYISSVIEYYEELNKINLSWEKIKDDVEDENLRVLGKYVNIKSLNRSNREYFWKDKKRHEVSLSSKEPQNGNGVTIEINDDMPNTGCKKGTTVTFSIEKDYSIKFPADMKKYACLDSISIEGLLIRYKGNDFKIEDGNLFIKKTISEIDSVKKENAEKSRQIAEEERLRKEKEEHEELAKKQFYEALKNAQNAEPSNDGLEYKFQYICKGKDNCEYSTYAEYDYYAALFNRGYMASLDWNYRSNKHKTFDLSKKLNSSLEFIIVMDWDRLNELNVMPEAGFVSGNQYVTLPIDKYFVKDSSLHPRIKKVSIPVNDFIEKFGEKSLNWGNVEGAFVSACSPPLIEENNSEVGFYSASTPHLMGNENSTCKNLRDSDGRFFEKVNMLFYGIINVVIRDSSPVKVEKNVASPKSSSSLNQSSDDEIAQRKERLKSSAQDNLEENPKQEKASAAAESAKQDDGEKSMSTTKILRIGVFSAVALGGGIAALVFDKKAKDATATPPANRAELQKGYDEAKQNQNVRNISLGVAAAGLVALGLTFLF